MSSSARTLRRNMPTVAAIRGRRTLAQSHQRALFWRPLPDFRALSCTCAACCCSIGAICVIRRSSEVGAIPRHAASVTDDRIPYGLPTCASASIPTRKSSSIHGILVDTAGISDPAFQRVLIRTRRSVSATDRRRTFAGHVICPRRRRRRGAGRCSAPACSSASVTLPVIVNNWHCRCEIDDLSRLALNNAGVLPD